MKNMYKMFLLFAVALFLLYCKSENKPLVSNIKSISIKEAFKQKKKAFISDYFSEVRYIPLETNDNCILSWKVDFELTEDLIIVRKFSNPPLLLLFDAITGKFLKDIGTIGRGPGEYESLEKAFFNPYNNLIYTSRDADRNIQIMDLNGIVMESFAKPVYHESTSNQEFTTCSIESFLNEEMFACGILNTTGHVNKKIAIFSKDGLIKIFPNFLTWGNDDPKLNLMNYKYGTSWRGAKIFYYFDNCLYYKEIFNDTLFQVTSDRLKPQYVFELGELGVPYKYQDRILVSETEQYYMQYFMIIDIDEYKDFIFIKIAFKDADHLCIYNKKSRQIFVCDNAGMDQSAIVDDINGFMPLLPRKITIRNEMICVLDPKDIVKWKMDNPQKTRELDLKLPWLKTINEFSNQVLVVAN